MNSEPVNALLRERLYREYLAMVRAFSGPAPSFEKWAVEVLRKESLDTHKSKQI